MRLGCPLGYKCGSQLEPYLLQDIIDEIVATSKEKTSRGPSCDGQTSSRSCPNDRCSFNFRPDDGDFETLYPWCPECCAFYCCTCQRRLGDEGYADHICPAGQITDITNDAVASQTLCRVVCEAMFVRCPSNSCQSTDRAEDLIVKRNEDCNAIKCWTCQRFFCFICTKDLGMNREDALKAFPHRNASEANAPCCWLFDDGLSGNTKTRALLIRQMNAAADYLRSLQVSNEKKLILLNSNREVLGEIFTHLIKKYGPKRDQEKCVIL